MGKGEKSSWRLKKVRFEVHDRAVGLPVEEPPFQHGGSTVNQKLIDAVNRGDWAYVERYLLDLWMRKEQCSWGYWSIHGLAVLATCRLRPQLRWLVDRWLEGWAYLGETHYAPKCGRVVIPGARSFMDPEDWTDCHRMLVRGEKVKRRISMKRARRTNNPTHLASELCRDLIRTGDLVSVQPSAQHLRLEHQITIDQYEVGGEYSGFISYCELKGYNENRPVVKYVHRKRGRWVADGPSGIVGHKAPTTITEEGRRIHWRQKGQHGSVKVPPGVRVRQTFIS
jgi:hypothetical protein